MKVLVLTGSPNPQGTTALLADEFCLGAEEAGHEIIRFDTAQLHVHPCIGCSHCYKNNGVCVYDDDMKQILPHLVEADALVLVTPLYYFDMSAQLKTVVDRFFSVNHELLKTPKKLCLIAAGGNENAWVMDGLKAHISTLCRFLNWQESGMVLAVNARNRQAIENSDYITMARTLGKSLK